MDTVWKPTRRSFVATCLGVPLIGWARAEPALMHASIYRDDLALDITSFWVSEKLDGVRAFWDGESLQTRSGRRIAAPDWFTATLPRIALDGELWGGRATFEATSGTIRTSTPVDADWRPIRYMIFDLPREAAVFDGRLRMLEELVARTGLPWLGAVQQRRLANLDALRRELQWIESLGGEGLMLHRGAAIYEPGRSADLLKLKSFEDAEARVVGHEPGQGKYAGLVGALVVEREDGVRFKLGSGLTDAQRRSPPPIGSTVTYAHNGFTGSGVPRFPRLLRVRGDEDG